MKKNNKGFTLAELLIVVAIIAVLVAVAIPIFSNQLEKSKEATDVANVRNAYAGVVTTYLETGASCSTTVAAKQAKNTWITSDHYLTIQNGTNQTSVEIPVKQSGGTWAVSINDEGSLYLDGTKVG